MTTRLRVLLLVLLCACGLALIKQITKKKVDIKYVLPWIFLVIGLGVLTIFPGVINSFTDWIGISLPINLLFLCGIVCILIIIYVLTITISKMSNEIKELSQKLALAENRLRRMEANWKNPE